MRPDAAHPWKEFVWNEWIHRLHKLLKFIVMQFQFNYFQWLICWILCSNFVTYFDQSLRSQKMGIVVFYETILCRSNFQFLFFISTELIPRLMWIGLIWSDHNMGSPVDHNGAYLWMVRDLGQYKLFLSGLPYSLSEWTEIKINFGSTKNSFFRNIS